jgi:hypothetical protein
MANLMERGCVVLVCLGVVSLGLVIGYSMGFPCWVLQQLYVLAVAFDVFPVLNYLPGINYFRHGFRQLSELYRRNPHLRSYGACVVRMIPILGWIVMLQELKVMAMVMLIGLPLDLGLQALTTFVWQLPVWGVASRMDFAEACAVQALMTFVVTPYLVLFVTAVTWNQDGKRPPRDASPENHTDDSDHDALFRDAAT